MSALGRRSVLTGVAVVVIAAAAVAYLQGRDYVFRFSEEELQASLAERLPFTRTYVLVVDVTLSEPRVNLVDGSERVGAGVDVEVVLPGLRGPLAIRGSVDGTSGVRYEPDSGEFFLEEPDLTDLLFEGVPDVWQDRVSTAVLAAVGTYFASRPIYVLDARDVRHATARLLLKDVTVADGAVVVTLGL